MKIILLTASFIVACLVSEAQVMTISNPQVIPLKFERLSPALRDVPEKPPTAAELNGPRVEHDNPTLEHPMLQLNPNALPKGADPALQKEYNALKSKESINSATATILSNWTGLAAAIDPSDNTIAVGPNHVMQLANNTTSSYMRVWNKAGTVLVNNKLTSSISGVSDYGDPNVIYDAEADRFVMLFLYSGSAKKLVICMSQTSDPTGAYYVYTLTVTNGYPDYPKIGVWGNSYFITTNSNTPTIFALDRTSMLAGSGTGTSQVFMLSSFPTVGFQSASPVTFTGSLAPPAGTPATIIRVADDAWGTSVGPDHLELFKINIDWVTPANSNITGPINLNTIAYNSNLCGYSTSGCVPMPGTSTKLDPLSNIAMDKVQYRNLGNVESIVCSHVCNADGSGTAGVRWYELRRDTGGDWYIYQQSTYSSGTDSRFMSSITINDKGTIALGYNISSSSVYPGIRITGRDSCDALNTMTVPETTAKAGTASNSSNRYGDYNAMVTDPSDGSFWFTANYNATSSWSTSVVHFTISPCAIPPVAAFNVGNTSGCDSLCTTFNDVSAGDTSRKWSFPGGSPSSSAIPNPAVCYSSPGSYSVTLITYNSFGSDTLVRKNYITINSTTKAYVNASGDTLVADSAQSYQWYDSTGAIPGAIMQSYNVLNSGYYHVCTQDSYGCMSCSDSVYASTTGFKENASLQSQLLVYPNPFLHTFIVQLPKGTMEESYIVISDILGREMISKNIPAEKPFVIDASSFSKGVYFLRLNTDDKIYRAKVVKE